MCNVIDQLSTVCTTVVRGECNERGADPSVYYIWLNELKQAADGEIICRFEVAMKRLYGLRRVNWHAIFTGAPGMAADHREVMARILVQVIHNVSDLGFSSTQGSRPMRQHQEANFHRQEIYFGPESRYFCAGNIRCDS